MYTADVQVSLREDRQVGGYEYMGLVRDRIDHKLSGIGAREE